MCIIFTEGQRGRLTQMSHDMINFSYMGLHDTYSTLRSIIQLYEMCITSQSVIPFEMSLIVLRVTPVVNPVVVFFDKRFDSVIHSSEFAFLFTISV